MLAALGLGRLARLAGGDPLERRPAPASTTSPSRTAPPEWQKPRQTVSPSETAPSSVRSPGSSPRPSSTSRDVLAEVGGPAGGAGADADVALAARLGEVVVEARDAVDGRLGQARGLGRGAAVVVGDLPVLVDRLLEDVDRRRRRRWLLRCQESRSGCATSPGSPVGSLRATLDELVRSRKSWAGMARVQAAAGASARTGASSTGMPLRTALPESGSIALLVGEQVAVDAGVRRRRRELRAGRVVAPAVGNATTPGMIASVTSTGTSIAPARELTRARPPSLEPEPRRRRRGATCSVQRGLPLHQVREVVHPGVVGAQVAAADQHQLAVRWPVERRREALARRRAIGSGASSIRPLGVRSTSGRRGSSAPRSMPCGAASSMSSVRPSGSLRRSRSP